MYIHLTDYFLTISVNNTFLSFINFETKFWIKFNTYEIIHYRISPKSLKHVNLLSLQVSYCKLLFSNLRSFWFVEGCLGTINCQHFRDFCKVKINNPFRQCQTCVVLWGFADNSLLSCRTVYTSINVLVYSYLFSINFFLFTYTLIPVISLRLLWPFSLI